MDTAKLTLGDKEYELPLIVGSEGETGVDIRKLRGQTGAITLDSGYGNTGSCESAITFIDGEKGILRYRGYPIEELAEHTTFTEICYLLVYGSLPNKKELEQFEHELTHHSLIHEDMKKFFEGYPPNAPPMSVLSTIAASLSAYYPANGDPKELELNIIRLLAKLKTIAAFSFKKSIGQAYIYPRNDLEYAENFLHMMFATPCEDYEVNPIIAKAMDRIFLLHADHEQNASTSTVRLAGSTGANPFACIAAGIAALWGPAHGGANEAVLKMLDEIGDEKNIDKYIKKAKDKDDPFRIMGFGHRVYKNYDPRAKVMQQTCHEVLNELGVEDNPILKMAQRLEKIALEDEYFVEKKLYPNVDFYSGIILDAMGFPTSMFTPIFALARTVGWISQWKEQLSDPKHKIGRPRQLYLGETERAYVDIENR